MSKNKFYIIGAIEPFWITQIDRYLETEKNPVIYIHSNGGDGDTACAIYDLIQNCGKQVTTIGIGRVESAGLYSLLAGHKRLAFPRTIFYYHPFNISDGRFFKKHTGKEKIFGSIFNKIHEEYFDIKKPLYFDVKEALARKVIHKIIKKL